MNTKTIVCAGVVAAAFGLAGCGSEPTTEATSTSAATETATSTSAAAPPLTTAPPTPAAPAAGELTIADYLKSANITETPVRAGDPGAPKLEFPVPAQWEQAIDVPGNPFWAVMMTTPADPANPPVIEARLSKLSADVPIQTIFDYAPGEIENLPGYQSLGDGGRASLAGLEAFQMGGLYEENGVRKLVAQKTLLIASPTGPYLLRVRASGPEDDTQALISATAALDDNTVITP
ncbi:LpqN/LpqT family lipoprotein [soil metagenome]